MNVHLRDARDLLVSLQLTLALLALSVVLVFVATLDQTNLGIWAVQEKYFRSFVVYAHVLGLNLPVFPGGYTIGGLLLANLVAAHVYRFAWSARKAGLWLVHAGLIVLLVGELLSGLWQQDYQLRLDEGETKNFSESYRENELVLVDVTDPEFDEVVAIPERRLAEKETLSHPKLPFRIETRAFYPNSALAVRPPNGPATLATEGVGTRLLAAPLPPTFKADERNLPSAFVELIAPDRSLGTYLVSLQVAAPQKFEYAGRTWRIELRPKRVYHPFSISLLKFSHDRYPGTEIPKNFSSRIRLRNPTGNEDREVLIYMNNPLRYAGLTFYQAGFENNDRTSVLQVVRNPSWLLPYVACGMMTLGLGLQFGIHLVRFARRRTGPAGGSPLSTATGAASVSALDAERRKPATGWIEIVVASVAVAVATGPVWRAPQSAGPFDTARFGELPVLLNGRVKPLDTVARTALLMLQGRQRVAAPAGGQVSPAEWLLDVMFRPEQADAYQTFEVVHPDVLTLMALTPEEGAGGKRFSAAQLKRRLRELDGQAKLAQATEAEVRTPFQRAVIKLRDSVMLYQRLQSSAQATGIDQFFERSIAAAAESDPARTRERLEELRPAFRVMDAFSYLRMVPLQTESPSGFREWATLGAAWNTVATTGVPDPIALRWAKIGLAWQTQDAAQFNGAVARQRDELLAADSATARRVRVETRFNAAAPFYTSALLYLAAFLAAVSSWLRWPQTLRSIAVALAGVAFALTTAGILTRMWLESRPPVTNLYSSALFVGWGAVALCFALEIAYRNAIAVATAGVIGFATLLIAHHLSLAGDTLEMMRAVLDSNFWLATHVVTVTIGYSATFLAGFLGLMYVLRGRFTASLDAGTADALARMIYGVVCFATLFSFVGTVLGGIWADQSWGRFWGWDPKENGALLIVVWNAIVLHARWGGLVRQRGLATLAIFGNIVTAWSWFGVNMLGIGLHSYGFMDAAFWWLIGFAGSQLAAIGLAAWPLERWWSFRASTRPVGAATANQPA